MQVIVYHKNYTLSCGVISQLFMSSNEVHHERSTFTHLSCIFYLFLLLAAPVTVI